MGLIVVTQVALVQAGGEIMGTVPLPFTDWVRITIASASVLVIGAMIRLFPPEPVHGSMQ
jgi:hypothetical protein